MKLLLDEMYPPSLAERLRVAGHDVLAVAEDSDITGADDYTVLARAAEDERCLVTENVWDFSVLAGQMKHRGILLVHPRRWLRDGAGINKLTSALAGVLEADQVPGRDETRWLS